MADGRGKEMRTGEEGRSWPAHPIQWQPHDSIPLHLYRGGCFV
jgi:hypothetical protein